MRKSHFIIAAGILAFGSAEASAQTATSSVTYEVQAINEMSLSGDPAALVINSATAGSAPDDAVNSATTWAITTNEVSKKVTGAIDTDMPAGVTLSVSLIAPAGGTSAGAKALSAVATDLVTGLGTVQESGMGVTYTLSATTDAGVVASASRTLTYTITDGI